MIIVLNTQVPNGIGTLFSVAQLILYATYYKTTQMQIAARKANKAEVNLSQVVVGNNDQRSKTNH
jgi:solute carrier family 50 protein (sugar transporter)